LIKCIHGSRAVLPGSIAVLPLLGSLLQSDLPGTIMSV
jgi:hypothetical protein